MNIAFSPSFLHANSIVIPFLKSLWKWVWEYGFKIEFACRNDGEINHWDICKKYEWEGEAWGEWQASILIKIKITPQGLCFIQTCDPPVWPPATGSKMAAKTLY